MKFYSHLIFTVLVLFLFSTASSSVQAKAPVWKVSKGDNHLYLGGTIHLLSSSDYPLPSAFENGFNNADTLVFETDIKAASSLESVQKLFAAMSYSDGRTLQSELDAPIYKELELFLSTRGIPITSFAKFTPAGVSLSLTMIELQRLGLSGLAGVDSYYNLRGINEGKEIEYLETLDDQIGFIASLNLENGNEIIKATLRDTEKLAETWEQILSAWRGGDMQVLEEVSLKQMQTDFPDVYQVMLVNRNNKWMKKLHIMFADPDIEYVLVGSLHMVGKDGLLEQLKEDDYRIEQLD